MKKLIYILALLGAHQLSAQTSVELNLHHKLGDSDFALNTEASNNLDDAFDITRLEYYISQIKLYSEGSEYLVEDTWILVDANEATSVDLGSYDISSIDSIKFSIGVEEAVNHDDPSTYDADHPLAHQSPSMHWGWVSGYRFVAMEGNASPDLNEIFQVHALDDAIYFEQTQTLDLVASDDMIVIDLEADYEKAMEDIDLSSGVIVHGSFGVAIELLENFRDLVFTPISGTTGIDELSTPSVEVYPNPLRSGEQITIQSDMPLDNISLFDMSGRAIQQWPSVNDVHFEAMNAGVYFLQCQSNGSAIKTIRIILQ